MRSFGSGLALATVLSALALGTSPASARWSTPFALTPDVEQGQEYSWDAAADRSGVVTVAYPEPDGALVVRVLSRRGALIDEQRFPGAAGWVDVEVAASGEAVLAWSDWSGPAQALFTSMRRPGGRFESPQRLSAELFEGEFHVEQSPSGAAAIAWVERVASFTDAESYRVRAARRRTGSAFESPLTLADGWRSAAQPGIALDRRGRTLVGWVGRRSGERALHVARAAAGRTFRAPRRVSPRGTRVSAWWLGAAADGSLTAAYFALSPHPDVTYAAAGSVREGLRRPRILGRGNFLSMDMAASRSRHAVVWQVGSYGDNRVLVSLAGASGRFGPRRVLSSRKAGRPRVLIDRDGTTIAAYQERRGPGARMWARQISSSGRLGQPEALVRRRRSLFIDGFALGLDPGGQVTALTQRANHLGSLIEAAVRPRGGRFGPTRAVVADFAPGPAGADEHHGRPRVLVGGRGRVFAAWETTGSQATFRIEASELR